MNQIHIITDSAADLTKDIPACVSVLPMHIRFGEEEFLDGVNLTHDRFYEKLAESDTLPVTSLISPAAFEEAYRTYTAKGDTVLVITVSGKLSGTYQSACLAAADFEGKVFVVDSLNATVGEQILVLYAAQLAEMGLPVEDIVDKLEEAKTRIILVAVLDTLEYLKKGGRISGTEAFVGGLLSIKPVVGVRDGVVVMLGKARGPKNGCAFLTKQIEGSTGIDFEKPVRLGYTGTSDAFLQTYIREAGAVYAGHEDALEISSIGATIGTHMGPGAIAAAFFAL